MANAAHISAERYAPAARWWRERFPDETQLPMPPEQLVRVISALTEGLTFQRLLTPELIPDDVIYAAFAALAESGAPTGRLGELRPGRVLSMVRHCARTKTPHLGSTHGYR